jgi:DNA-binding transcriptional LysR family regulator
MSLSPQLSLAALRAFAGIVETGSVTGAARALNVSQSAVSHHLKSVESLAGCQLFLRKGPQLVLTETGGIFYADVRDALNLLHNAEGRFSRGGTTRLIVGVQYSFAYHVLLPNLAAMRERFPALEIELVALPNVDGVRERHIDLYITAWDIPGASPVAAIETPWRPFARTGLVAGRDWKSGAWPLITFESGTDWRRWGLVPERNTVSWIRSDSAGLTLEMVKLGLGIGLCAEPMAGPAWTSGLIEPVDQQSVKLDWGQLNFHRSNSSPHRQHVEEVAGWLLPRFTAGETRSPSI